MTIAQQLVTVESRISMSTKNRSPKAGGPDNTVPQKLSQDSIGEVVIHPVFSHAFASVEHAQGELAALGDALGRDCWVIRFLAGWYRLHADDGTRNEDWYGWGAAVLAPFDRVVESVRTNPLTNQPGHNPGGRASTITFRRDDGTFVLYAHVDHIAVQPGDAIKAGQHVARVGNNGTSQRPHIHVGAWRDDTPLQIRFDLQALSHLQAADPDRYFVYAVPC